jgi:hypothetical protein
MPSRLEILKLRMARYRRIHLPRQTRRLKAVSRHAWFKVPVITFGTLIVLCGVVWLVASRTHKLPKPTDANIVIISHDHSRQVVPSKEATVGKLLDKLHIKMGAGDVEMAARLASKW